MEDDVLSQLIDAIPEGVAPNGNLMDRSSKGFSNALLETILATLDEEKAEEVVTISLSGKSEIADHMVVASGRSSRHVAAVSSALADKLKADSGLICKVEGKDTGDWVLIDAGDVIVHVFRPEVRTFYQLEKMWTDPGAPVDPI